MSLRYQKIKKHPTIFLRLFGVSVLQFELIMKRVHPLWKKKVLARYQRPGRDFKLDLEDMVLMVLLYYRSYVTQMFVSFLFGIDDSRVCRLIQKIEPLLAKVMALSKARSLSQKEVESLIIDAAEQALERPKKGQKKYYSGKKKRHTLKTEIRVTLEKRIVHVSKTYPGSIHDFSVHKQEPLLPKKSRVYVDLGYQGLDKRHRETELPYKAFKKKPLDKEEKQYNQALSRIRVKVENVLAQIKVFKIMSDRYRNKRKRYTIKFNIIAGIVNMKNGFMTA
jgi:IS5 family transposase